MTRKESEPDDRALRPRTDGLIVIDFADEAAKLAQTSTSNGRQALSLVKDGPLNVLLMTLKKAQSRVNIAGAGRSPSTCFPASFGFTPKADKSRLPPGACSPLIATLHTA